MKVLLIASQKNQLNKLLDFITNNPEIHSVDDYSILVMSESVFEIKDLTIRALKHFPTAGIIEFKLPWYANVLNWGRVSFYKNKYSELVESVKPEMAIGLSNFHHYSILWHELKNRDVKTILLEEGLGSYLLLGSSHKELFKIHSFSGTVAQIFESALAGPKNLSVLGRMVRFFVMVFRGIPAALLGFSRKRFDYEKFSDFSEAYFTKPQMLESFYPSVKALHSSFDKMKSEIAKGPSVSIFATQPLDLDEHMWRLIFETASEHTNAELLISLHPRLTKRQLSSITRASKVLGFEVLRSASTKLENQIQELNVSEVFSLCSSVLFNLADQNNGMRVFMVALQTSKKPSPWEKEVLALQEVLRMVPGIEEIKLPIKAHR